MEFSPFLEKILSPTCDRSGHSLAEIIQNQKLGDPIGPEKKIVSFEDKGWGVTMDSGSIRPINKSVDWSFNNWDYDFDLAVLDIAVYVTDYDGSGCDREKANSQKKLYGREFFDNEGVHNVKFQASDFEGHFVIKLKCLKCN